MKSSPKEPTTNFSIQLNWGPLALQGPYLHKWLVWLWAGVSLYFKG